MKQIGEIINDPNIILDTLDPVARLGFTQVPNFVLKDSDLSLGAKVTYAMFLSYAWHNASCFPGQDRLAEDMGMSRPSVTAFVNDLEKAGLGQPIVPESLWNEVNQIIEEQTKGWKRPGKTTVHLFSGLAQCTCGAKMYVRAKSPKYVCRKCCNKIAIKDLEEICHLELKAFFAQPERIAAHLQEAGKNLTEKETLLAAHQKEIQKVREEMARTHRLYVDGQITGQGFGEFYKPAEERLNQLTAELPKLQAEVDFIKVNKLSADEILNEANTLYDQWPKLPTEDKRKIAESLIEKIVIGENEIDITFSYLPSCEEVCKNQQRLGLG